MDTTLKQRILGIIVLFALLGLCLTVLLHNNKNSQREERQLNNANRALVSTTTALVNASPTTLAPGTTTSPAPAYGNPALAPAPVNQGTAITTASNSNPTLQNNVTPSSTPAPTTVNTNSLKAITASTAAQPASTASAKPVTSQTATAATMANARPADLFSQPQQQNAVTNTNEHTTANPAAASQAISSSKIAAISNTRFADDNTAATKNKPLAQKATAPAYHTTSHKTATHNNNTASAATESKTSNTSTTGKTFAVQLGSFNLVANAETLVDKLRANGFKASLQKIQTSKGEMTRVVVGSTGLSRQTAETLKLTLAKNLHLQGIIIANNKTNVQTTAKSSKTPAAANTASNTSNGIVPEDSNI